MWLILLVLLLTGMFQSAVFAKDAEIQKLEPVTMQLRWHHQFQFAGYYAALHKGFYRDRGLDVTILEGSPERRPVSELLSGRALYGEANSELLYHYLQGEQLVALAPIFQHSPSVLLTAKDSGISTVHDLAGKRVMMVGGTEDIDFLAMMANEGIKKQQVNIINSSYNVQDLIDGKTDAFNAYLTNEPFFLKEKGFHHNIIKPVNYGVDFYSDILFTTENEIKNHPGRVKAFREATLMGWEYAMANKQEMINLILAEYGSEKTREHLQYEAESMESLILPTLIPIGNINPGRFKRMADTLVKFGLAEPGYSLQAFIYDPNPSIHKDVFLKTVLIIGILLALAVFIALFLWQFNKRLKKEINQRHDAEKQLEQLAFYDSLTNLPNRRLLMDRLNQDIALVKRRGLKLAVLFIDLDGFKIINDSYGHVLGDQFLVLLSQVLGKSLREGDTIARLGGDEFVALLMDLQNEEEAYEVINRILKRASAAIDIDGRSFSVSASIGVTFYSDDNDISADTLLRQADQAMYKAKTDGKNRYYLFDVANPD